MADRTTKALLFAIALGLWADVAGQWLRPVAVHAQGSSVETVLAVQTLDNDLLKIGKDVQDIALGSCSNAKICK